MRRLHVLVEGQTEEALCHRVVGPYLESVGWHVVTWSVLETRRAASCAKFRGGVGAWNRIRRDLRRLLASQFDVVTTMFDYYGFPPEAPGMAGRPTADGSDRVGHVENAIAADVADPRFVPHLVLHETEAWVFAASDALAELVGDAGLARELAGIAAAAGGPEMVNDSPSTAPSKRLSARVPRYQKTLHGPLSIEAVGLDKLREQCPHLDSWLVELEQRATSE